MKLIGLTGKAHSGKDTVATYLWTRYAYTRVAFGDPLKAAAQEMFALTDDQTWNPEFKEVVIPYWGMSPRTMFQLLGTEAVQPVFGTDVWIKRWLINYKLLCDTDHIVVPDVRREEEAENILERGGVIARIKRTGAGLSGESAKHSSESGIPDSMVRFIIQNNSSIGELERQVDALIEVLGE